MLFGSKLSEIWGIHFYFPKREKLITSTCDSWVMYYYIGKSQWLAYILVSLDPNDMCLGALKSEGKSCSDAVYKYIQWQTNNNYHYIRKS